MFVRTHYIRENKGGFEFFHAISVKGSLVQGLDGVSLVPLLKGGSLARDSLYWHYPHYSNQGGAPAGSVRVGDWKLIEWYEDGALELFNLREDPGERNNLAAERPDKRKELQDRLKKWRQDVRARMPTPNPGYSPR